MSQKNCMIAQSGGPTAAINASLSGAINKILSLDCFDTIYGSIHGITGIFDHNILNLSEIFKNNSNNQHLLTHSPAMFLGSCRYKLPNDSSDNSLYQEIFDTFHELNIGAFFYIGGNDSMDTVYKLSAYATKINSPIQIIGIPKTIDNDLNGMDHTPGFGSAAKYIATSVLEIAHDAYIYEPKSITIVEIMGRDTGWLTASAALARNEYNKAPHLIYLPEQPFDKASFLDDVNEKLLTNSNLIIAVSEGIRDKDGNFISAGFNPLDTFGHTQLGGAGKYLESFIKANLDIKVRSIELNVLQRCAAHFTSETDISEAVSLGEKAVELACDGKSGCMVTLNRCSNSPYQVQYGSNDISEIANHVKYVPKEFITSSGNDITDAFLAYLKPLIIGESKVEYKDGLPSYLNISHLIH